MENKPITMERHYKPKELAEVWGFSENTIRAWFQDEPGVLKLGTTKSGRRRGYVSIRIPESIARKVHAARSQ
jgi:hypothetical protein